MTREPVLPAVRAAMFTAVCLGLGVAAHRAMSDAAIPPWALVLAGVGGYASARVGARRECGLLGIAVLMGGLQVALHLLFAFAQDAAAPGSSTASMSGMSMPAGASMSMPGMPMPVHGASMSVAHGGMRMSAGMLLAHAVAALVCVWWLRRGEAAVHALVRGAARWIVCHLVVPVLAVAGRVPDERRFAARVEPVALALRSQWLRTTRGLRGPPVSPSFT